MAQLIGRLGTDQPITTWPRLGKQVESGWEPSDALSSSGVGVINASKPWIGIWSCLSWSGFPGVSRGNSGRTASATGPSKVKGVTALKEKRWEGRGEMEPLVLEAHPLGGKQRVPLWRCLPSIWPCIFGSSGEPWPAVPASWHRLLWHGRRSPTRPGSQGCSKS